METETTEAAGMPAGEALRRAESEEDRRRAAAMLGRARTPRKAEAARANGLAGGRPEGFTTPEETREKQAEAARQAWAEKKRRGETWATGRAPRPLSEYECTCGAGDAIEGHKTTCPRGLAIWRRKKAGKL